MSFLHAKIATVGDTEFQILIDELYHCVDWQRDDDQFPTLFYLLSAINVQDPKALSASRLPGAGILTMKIDKLPQGVIYDLCRELTAMRSTHIESLDGKAVISLMKIPVAKPSRKRNPSRGEARHYASTSLIMQRRANGDL